MKTYAIVLKGFDAENPSTDHLSFLASTDTFESLIDAIGPEMESVINIVLLGDSGTYTPDCLIDTARDFMIQRMQH